jgi:replicative DNA helicase
VLEEVMIPELEKSIIGSVLISPENLALLPSIEMPDFPTPIARYCWRAIRNLETANKPIDLITISDEVCRYRTDDRDNVHDQEVKRSEVDGYLGLCAYQVPTVDNAIEYARRLKDHSLKRRVRDSLREVLDAEDATGAELLSMALGGLSVLDAEQPEQARSIKEVIERRMKQLDEIQKAKATGQAGLTGMPTGVRGLDDKIGGFQPGIVSLVAARPSVGKSSFGLATADECTRQDLGVHVFSLEDTESAYADRSMARVSGVSAESIRNCDIRQGDMQSLQSSLPSLRTRRWLFDDRSGITAQEIVRSVRRHKKPNQTKLVIVDYIQLVAKPSPRLTTHEALSENISTFADAAKQDSIAYVVMSQLNREIEKREDKRPQLSDLRESGSLEERSKCVIGLYRGSIYGKRPKKGIDYQVQEPSQEDFEKQIQLLVLKNSNGRTGRVFATWHGPTTRVD